MNHIIQAHKPTAASQNVAQPIFRHTMAPLVIDKISAQYSLGAAAYPNAAKALWTDGDAKN